MLQFEDTREEDVAPPSNAPLWLGSEAFCASLSAYPYCLVWLIGAWVVCSVGQDVHISFRELKDDQNEAVEIKST